MKNLFLLVICTITMSFTATAQDTPHFPIETIDTSIINKRGLQEKVKMLSEDCFWPARIGKKIDVFWIQEVTGNYFGYSYEYFMDCDNVRLIYWYDNPSGLGRPVDFMIENLEDESMFVAAKNRHLKNKKKYQHLLEENKTE